MSANNHDTGHNEIQIGPLKFTLQTLGTVGFSYVLPIVIAITLVFAFLGKDSATNRAPSSADTIERGTSARIQKVGSLSMQSGPRELKSGEQVYSAQCAACHASGAAGAPKFGDAGAWGPRIGTGFASLLNSALKGKGAMGPQGGGNFSDLEIGRGVVHMANAGGAKFEEPKAPAAAK
jgi:cytochrome c5